MMIMPTKLRKTRKMRGSFTCGYGAKKKHRGKGSKGGKGYAGSHKHHMTYIAKYEPDHFGKKGFYSRKKKESSINVEELEKMEGNDINLTEKGYGKLTGKGKISKAVNVTVSRASKHAKEKIANAGGTIKLDEEKEDFGEFEEEEKKDEPSDDDAIEEDSEEEPEENEEENE